MLTLLSNGKPIFPHIAPAQFIQLLCRFFLSLDKFSALAKRGRESQVVGRRVVIFTINIVD
jgi:hypothetical protein